MSKKDDTNEKGTEGKKVSRRDFAKTSVAAGAAAVALPTALRGEALAGKGTSTAAKAPAAAARGPITMPPEVSYGGLDFDGRDVLLEEVLSPPGKAPSYPGGWQEGTTMPAEYYLDEKHWLNEEGFLRDHFWFMADHESRIANPGDYFLFEYGRGDSVIIARAEDGSVKAHHNVCRHRGSRICLDDQNLPGSATSGGKPEDPRLSVVQQGPSGNTAVFRCPYHAWTYDLDGKLISFPTGMPEGFDENQHGLHPAHVQIVEGFIFVNLAEEEPTGFDEFVANWRRTCQFYGTAGMKVAARTQHPTKANWKLAVENFEECYHCEPAHKSLVEVQWWQRKHVLSDEQVADIEQELVRHQHPDKQQRRGAEGVREDAYSMSVHLAPGYVTGSLDGKPVAPLLLDEWTHMRRGATTGFSTSFFAAYDDHIAVARFTPRDIVMTDVEIFWLVKGDAKDSEVDVERMMELWDVTYREDLWIVENNQHGIRNSRYNHAGGQPYARREGGPAGFTKWYMTEIAPHA
jgi:phenylpropionate dioxygenase-like ring-hydroxylating dioxygenase large terminal subunit